MQCVMDRTRSTCHAGPRRPRVGGRVERRWPLTGVAARHLGAAYRAQTDIVATYAALYPGAWAAERYPRAGFAGPSALTALAARLVARLAAEERLPLKDGVWNAAEQPPSPVPWLPWFVFSIPLDGDQDYHALFEYEGPPRTTAALILFEWLADGCFALHDDILPFLRASASALGPAAERVLDAVMERAAARCRAPDRVHGRRPDDLLADDPSGVFARRADALRHIPLAARYLTCAHDNIFLSCHDDWWRQEAAAGNLRWSPDLVTDLAQEWAAARVVQEATKAVWEELSEPASLSQFLPLLATMLDLPVAMGTAGAPRRI